VLADAAREACVPRFELVRYRETRSAGMLELQDPAGCAAQLAERLHEQLAALGVYRREARPWLPHVTVVRYRERPRLQPPLPPVEAIVPSGAAAFLSRLHPTGAQYDLLEQFQLGG
jgi:2'-5' RNA ligase